MKKNALYELYDTCCCLFTTLIENLRVCSSAEAGIILNLFLNLSKNEPRVLMKLSL